MMPPGAVTLAAPFVARWEGFCARPYRCPSGYPSIGYGSRAYPDGRPVDLRDPPIDEHAAELFLKASLAVLTRVLEPALHRPPGLHEAAALLCLAYNIGGAALRGSTLLRLFNAGDRQGAADQFLAWDKGRVNGAMQSMAGLARRRAAERTLFITPDPEMA